ncbi:unnamed protein product [Mytilus coruscus]|uniref:Uncharacterized protein n=1 Tax=Mytilus coruscus TaxID=42192 RepID=A0A6J8DCH6_MYTCO|nr:unnamed protein product [Mytilus coruscus]
MKVFCLLILLCCDHAATSVVHTTLKQNNDTKSNSHMVYDPHNQTSQDNKTHEHGNKTGHEDSHTGHGAGHGIHLFSINYDHVAQPLLITVFLFAAGISKLGFHHADFLSSRVPESWGETILHMVGKLSLNDITYDHRGETILHLSGELALNDIPYDHRKETLLHLSGELALNDITYDYRGETILHLSGKLSQNDITYMTIRERQFFISQVNYH